MRSFNVSLAQRGASIITRGGKQVRILCYDRVDEKKGGNIMALIMNDKKTWEMPAFYNNDGRVIDCYDPQLDLMIND